MDKNLKKYNKIFFIGICGISMSGLAIILKNQGKKISGSDINSGEIKKKLKRNGIKVYSSHKKTNVKNCDLVVYSGAISSDNPEFLFAKERGIDCIERSELLYLVSKDYKNVIAISGTHGKTTTTAMIAYIFMVAGLNPTIHLGGEFDFINGNIHCGDKKYFITEACEFRDSFLTLKPKFSVVNNIEEEHLDYFKNFQNEKYSFKKFVNQTKQASFVNEKCVNYIGNCEKVKTFGYKENNIYYIKDVKQGDDLKYTFDFYKKGTFIGNFKLNIFGKHNLENAMVAIAVCLENKIDYKFIYLGLKTFNNVHRRFEYVGNFGSCPVVQDYAHHPTEIFNTIKTAKEVFKRKIICVFQPHTYSRTKLLIENFTKCFNGLDSLYLLKTYSAREKFDYLGSADYLKEKILQTKPTFAVRGVFDKKQILSKLIKNHPCDSVILFLGAGDIEQVCKKLLKY